MKRLIAALLLTPAVALSAQFGVALTDEQKRINMQSLKRTDNYKLYYNLDIYDPQKGNDTRVSTRLLGHYGNKYVHMSVRGTYATGYEETRAGVGFDLLDKQLLGVDMLFKQEESTAFLGYWGLAHNKVMSDGFVDYKEGDYSGRANLMYNVYKKFDAGYEYQHGKQDYHFVRLRFRY